MPLILLVIVSLLILMWLLWRNTQRILATKPQLAPRVLDQSRKMKWLFRFGVVMMLGQIMQIPWRTPSFGIGLGIVFIIGILSDVFREIERRALAVAKKLSEYDVKR